MIPLHWYLIVAAGMFGLGLYGVLPAATRWRS